MPVGLNIYGNDPVQQNLAYWWAFVEKEKNSYIYLICYWTETIMHSLPCVLFYKRGIYFWVKTVQQMFRCTYILVITSNWLPSHICWDEEIKSNIGLEDTAI